MGTSIKNVLSLSTKLAEVSWCNELREEKAEVMVSRHSSISNNFRSFVISGQTNERDSVLRLIEN